MHFLLRHGSSARLPNDSSFKLEAEYEAGYISTRDSDRGETSPPFGAPLSPSGFDPSDTLSVDADCSSSFSSSPVAVAGVALRSIGIFLATSAVANFLFPFLASEPQTYGMGGLQQQLWDVFL